MNNQIISTLKEFKLSKIFHRNIMSLGQRKTVFVVHYKEDACWSSDTLFNFPFNSVQFHRLILFILFIWLVIHNFFLDRYFLMFISLFILRYCFFNILETVLFTKLFIWNYFGWWYRDISYKNLCLLFTLVQTRH